MRKQSQKLLHTIQIRVTAQEKSKIKAFASLYAGGNISLWMAYAAMNAPRKHLVKRA